MSGCSAGMLVNQEAQQQLVLAEKHPLVNAPLAFAPNDAVVTCRQGPTGTRSQKQYKAQGEHARRSSSSISH